MATSAPTRGHDADVEEVADPAGRAGLGARGVLYLLVGVLAAQVATGNRGQEDADPRGALAEVAARPFGKAVLLALAVGFGCYAAWRLVRAVVGEEPGGPEPHERLADLGKVAVYGALLASTIAALQGEPSEDPAQTWTAQLMTDTWGRWVVGAAGAATIAVGAWNVHRGVSERFRRHLERQRRWVVRLGVVGHIARGVAFAAVGFFVVRAAVRFDPNEPVGLDAALREVATMPHGPGLILGTAVGFAAFGVYSIAEARDRRVLHR